MLYDGTVELVKPVQCPGGTTCRNGARQRQVFLYSNGVNTTVESERRTVQALANHTGRDILLVHNGSSGLLPDLAKLARANMGSSVYRAAGVEAGILEKELEKGVPTVMLCHSAGCAQLNETLSDVKEDLKKVKNPATGKPYTEDEIQRAQRTLERRLDYGPANTRLVKGPYSKITTRKGDIASPLELLTWNQYDERKELDALSKKGFLDYVPLANLVTMGLRAHNFNDSYMTQAVQDIESSS